MHSDPSSEPLAAAEGGPSQVVRHGDTILRPAQPWTPTIHALLRHLEAVGFAGAPGWSATATTDRATKCSPTSRARSSTRTHGAMRQSGASGGCCASSTTPPQASAPRRRRSGSRGTSTATRPARSSATATPAPGTSWPVMACRWPSSTGPWPGPTDRRDEVAATGWWNAQLHDDDIAEANHRADAVTRGAQLRQFLDGYGLPAAEGAGLVTHMIEFAIRDCAWEAIRAQVTPESTDPTPLWALAWRARAAAWMIRHRPTLQHAIEPYSSTTGPPGSSP
jgi:hypothetical protein